MQKLFIAFLLAICFISCKKESDNNDNNNQEINSWTFTAGSTVYKGDLFGDALLNTLLQGNDSYTFAMLGGQSTSDGTFNIVMSLLDTTFATKNYQSGVSGTDYITAFYYTHGLGGDEIYKSSNYSPGAIMNYVIQSYDPSTKILVITFSGQAKDASGNIVPITNGKVTCRIEKM
jgi:hypothetical protein